MLHRYATPLGLAAAATVTVILGAFTHWSWPIMAAAAIAGIWVFPRTFYGRAASRVLDEAPGDPNSLWSLRRRSPYLLDIAGADDKSVQLEQAYLAAQAAARGELDINGNADPNALRKIADEKRGEHN